jgi:hypothetical protein
VYLTVNSFFGFFGWLVPLLGYERTDVKYVGNDEGTEFLAHPSAKQTVLALLYVQIGVTKVIDIQGMAKSSSVGVRFAGLQKRSLVKIQAAGTLFLAATSKAPAWASQVR